MPNTSLIYLVLLLAFANISCGENKAKVALEPIDPTMEIGTTTPETLSFLYDRYYTDPQTQAEKDENLIIDYITEHNIAVEYSPEGIYYQITKAGKGDPIKWSDRISVHYKGYRLDGVEFDSSYKRGKPINFRVGEMIDGWNHTLKRMKRGDEALLIIPSRLAYGNEGRGSLVRSNDVLIFEIKIEE